MIDPRAMIPGLFAALQTIAAACANEFTSHAHASNCATGAAATTGWPSQAMSMSGADTIVKQYNGAMISAR